MPDRSRPVTPSVAIAVLSAVPLATGLMPGACGRDAIALFAMTAAVFAAHERRDRDMLVAATLGAATSSAALLLAPLVLGLAIGRGAARHLPLSLAMGAAVAWLAPWSPPAVPLPNLATLTVATPTMLGLWVAPAAGIGAWLVARASVAAHGAVFAEARLGTLLLAALLPLPLDTLGFVILIAALPLPEPRRLHAANDNLASRRTIHLAA